MFKHVAVVKPIGKTAQKVFVTIPIRKWRHKGIPLRRTAGHFLVYEAYEKTRDTMLSALQKAHIEEE